MEQRDGQEPLRVDDIAKAETEAQPKDLDPTESKNYEVMVSRLQSEVAELRAELDSEKARNAVSDVRAGLMQPYANKVFAFLCWYCTAVGLIIIVSAAWPAFQVPELVQSIIAGSTTVSAIGLVGFVVNGLFKN